MSRLQLAYAIAELREQGIPNSSIDLVCKIVRNALTAAGPSESVVVPTSTHLVEATLGVRSPQSYEFGWCPGCGYRYPTDAGGGGPCSQALTEALQSRLLDQTCGRCGTPKFKVSLRPMSVPR